MTQTIVRIAPQALRSADFSVADSAIDAVLQRHARQTYDIADPVWQGRQAKEISARRLGWRRWLRRLVVNGRNAREQIEVQNTYETHWALAATVDEYVAGLNERVVCVSWGRQGYIVATQALRQVHMLYLMQAIEVLKPRSVLEVGCGNGNVVLTLAARFPEIKFVGVELTPAGVAAAQAMQALPELPASFVSGSPEPLRDLAAHRTVDLRVGNAAELQFPDNSFDLVYTRLALEQMELVREKALKEIARVSANAVVLIEPWRDYNLNDPGRAYVRRMGYFTGKISHLAKLGFKVVMSTGEIPQKVQFNAGPVVAVRA